MLITHRVLIVGIIFQGRHDLNPKGQIAPACFGINLIKNCAKVEELNNMNKTEYTGDKW